MADQNDSTTIVVDGKLFSVDDATKTREANKVAKRFGISDEALQGVEDFKDQLTSHKAWDLPFMGYVNEDGYGYAYVPDQAVAPGGWDAHKAFTELPPDVQTAFAIRMLFTHRDVDRYGANMFLHYDRGLNIRFDIPVSQSY
ncbi:glycerophosphodiester phosphodiesterase [Bombiscardovia coagulans]|uniref:Glycerophosphodiester phosphodiesterase n=1 Tax=Bombiscardovia coagulans TaxID=686666 RepID=A0A261EQ06_9BIFI|nr:glycerophosphodiester phosphodiesterase [Bombiscardovia coagulans]OZG48934.1 glycerophosphodiester phosphodiesterase [Bombiscardovia coagulans]